MLYDLSLVPRCANQGRMWQAMKNSICCWIMKKNNLRLHQGSSSPLAIQYKHTVNKVIILTEQYDYGLRARFSK